MPLTILKKVTSTQPVEVQDGYYKFEYGFFRLKGDVVISAWDYTGINNYQIKKEDAKHFVSPDTFTEATEEEFNSAFEKSLQQFTI